MPESAVGNVISEVTLSQVLPLRSRVLRNGQREDQCLFLQDGKVEAVHFGLAQQGEIVAVASFYRRPIELERLPDESSHLAAASGCQLRGMAVDMGKHRRGLGKQLLEQALASVFAKWSPLYFWCYAVPGACEFYEAMGFQYVGEEFEMPYVGPLDTMLKFSKAGK